MLLSQEVPITICVASLQNSPLVGKNESGITYDELTLSYFLT